MKLKLVVLITLIVAAVAASPVVRVIVREYKFSRDYTRNIEALRREAAEWEAYVKDPHSYIGS